MLSTRHGFCLRSGSCTRSACWLAAVAVEEFQPSPASKPSPVKPRESEQVALTVICAGRSARRIQGCRSCRLPEMLPPVAVQLETVTGTLSGLVQVEVMVDVARPARIVGFAEQDMVGGFFAGSFTVKFAVQLLRHFSSASDR